MNTIEDMGREYQRSNEADGTEATAFVAGAEWMRAELTRWHDPKEPPAHMNTVLVKIEDDVYNTGYYDSDYGGFFTGCGFYYLKNVVGWREI